MTDERRRLHLSGTAWLGEGPGRAPEHLLSSILEQTAAMPQRHAWLARAARTPSEGARVRQPVDLRVAVLLALIAVAMSLAVAILAGAFDSDDLSVAPSDQVRPSQTTATQLAVASPPPGPRPSASPLDALVVEHVYEDQVLGFSLAYRDPYLQRGIGLGAPLPTTAEPGRDQIVQFPYGTCNLVCTMVSVRSAPIDVGVLVSVLVDEDGSEQELRVKGRSLDELRASWLDVFGNSTFEEMTLGLDDSLLAVASSGRSALLAIHGGRDVAIVAERISPFGPHAELDRAALRDVLFNFQFVSGPDAPFDGTPQVVAFGHAPTGHVTATVPGNAAPIYGTASVTFPVATRMLPSFDPVVAGSIVLTLEEIPLFEARRLLLVERRTIRAVDMTVGDRPAFLILPSSGLDDPPVALIGMRSTTYRLQVVGDILSHREPGEPGAVELLRRFLAGLSVQEPTSE